MSIVSHISVGTSPEKFGKMLQFYDAVMMELGAKRQMVIDNNGNKVSDLSIEYSNSIVAVAYGKYYPEFWVQLPGDGNGALPGNGVHIAFSCKSQAHVHQVYQVAMEGILDGISTHSIRYCTCQLH